MLFLDSTKRKKVFIDKNIKSFTIELDAQDLREMELQERYPFIESKVSELMKDLKDEKAVLFDVAFNETEESVYSLEEIYSLISDFATAYAKTFETNVKLVKFPTEGQYRLIHASPMTVNSLLSIHRVNIPVQIRLNRFYYNKNDEIIDSEIVGLV